MNTKIFGAASLLLASLVSQAPGQFPDTPLRAPIQDAEVIQPGGKDQPKQPDKEKKPPEKKGETPLSEFIPPVRTREFSTGYIPQMLGDYKGFFAQIRILVTGTQTTTTQTITQTNNPIPTPPLVTTQTTTTTITQVRTILVPYAGYGPFKMAENASPMPVDRVFVIGNYFNGIRDPQNGPIGPSAFTTTFTGIQTKNGSTVQTAVTTTTVLPGTPRVNMNLYREVFGFEKTLLDGRASVELRVPFHQMQGNVDAFGSSSAGDLTIVGKYAFLLNRDTGGVLSGGLAVTAPTGPGIDTIDGRIHSVLLQPWGGFILPIDRFYLHGFHSVVIPTDSRDVTLLFNDVGIGYQLYRGDPGRLLRAIVPTAEIHVTTPLTHRNGTGPIFAPDMVAFTGGVHFGLGRSSTLSFGAATPITGPRTYSVEGLMQFNWRF